MRPYVYPVRWLQTQFGGANQYHQDRTFSGLIKSLRFELTTLRERSFAYTNGNAIGSAWLGLLVDLPLSEIEVIYKEDCYSLRYRNGIKLISREYAIDSYCDSHTDDNGEQTISEYRLDHDRRQSKAIKNCVGQHMVGHYDRWDNPYHEALGYLKFCGIVLSDVKHESFRTEFAKDMAQRFKIPYLGKLRTFRPGKYMSY